MLNFNSSSTTARIEVTDYSQYNNDKDFTAGVTKLNTEIISGNVPDLFVTTDLPMGQYAAKGLLKDIYELIDADGELKRESFMTPVLKALETDGKLYSIAPGFGIVTLIGKSDVVGKDLSLIHISSGVSVSGTGSLPQAARLKTMTRARHSARNLAVFFIFLVLSFRIFARFISFIKLISILQRIFIK